MAGDLSRDQADILLWLSRQSRDASVTSVSGGGRDLAARTPGD